MEFLVNEKHETRGKMSRSIEVSIQEFDPISAVIRSRKAFRIWLPRKVIFGAERIDRFQREREREREEHTVSWKRDIFYRLDIMGTGDARSICGKTRGTNISSYPYL